MIYRARSTSVPSARAQRADRGVPRRRHGRHSSGRAPMGDAPKRQNETPIREQSE